MEEPFSAPSPNPRFSSPEDYLAEVDNFVQSVQTAGKSRPADAQMLQALLAQAELYLKAGRSEVAATAYERLLVIMRHFEGITPPAAPLVDGRSDPGTASERLEATAPRQRIVHVERRRIRPYRSPDADTSNPPVVDEIQRSPAPPGFRVSAVIPTSRGQPFWRRLLPLVVVVVLLAAAWLAFINRNSLRAAAGLAGVKPPSASVAALLPAASATPAVPMRAPVASQVPTRAALTATAPVVTSTVILTATFVLTPTVVLAPTVTPTSTPSPTVTDTPSPTPTPSATVTATPTSTGTPSPTPTIIFTGPDPLAGATQLLFEEDFNPKSYYWLVGETTFGHSSITPGGLEITTKTPHTIAWVFGGVPLGQNFFELATVTMGACDTNDRVGLVLRAETDSNLLLFGVNCDGRYRLQEVQGATEHLLVLPTPSDVIQTGPGAVNELGVRADGNQISLYINRQFLTRVATTDLSKGRFGVFVNSTTTANLTATFGRIRAWVIAP